MNDGVKNGLKFGVGVITGVAAYVASATILNGLMPDDEGILSVIEDIGVGAISGWIGFESSKAAMRKIDTLDRAIKAISYSQQTT